MSNPAVVFEGLSLPVANLEASVAFYESLGFAAEIHNRGFVLLRLGTGTLGLLEVGERALPSNELSAGMRTLVQVELGTDDLDGLYAELLAKGITVRVPPRDRGFERSMQCLDPDGFTVEFAEGPRGHNATAGR